MTLKTKDRAGFGMIGIIVAIVAVGMLMISITRLLISMSQGVGNLNERLEMQSIIKDQWRQLNAGTYEDFEDIVTAKGPTWTEALGEKYDLKVEFGQNGKYVNATCDTSSSVSDMDQQCRKVTITAVSKALPDVMESLQMTRISEPDEKELLKKIEEHISENGNKFNTLYTKTESDARYIRYGMGDFACPLNYKKNAAGNGCDACDAPANDMQYRSGNCQLSTCPSGQMANAAQDGCEERVCGTGDKLNAAGNGCEPCTGIPEGSERKKYYGANCSIQTCPVGQEVTDGRDGCQNIVCPTGMELHGDDCKCPSNQIYDETSFTCKSCPTGQKANATQTACEKITCPSGYTLQGNSCVEDEKYEIQGVCVGNPTADNITLPIKIHCNSNQGSAIKQTELPVLYHSVVCFEHLGITYGGGSEGTWQIIFSKTSLSNRSDGYAYSGGLGSRQLSVDLPIPPGTPYPQHPTSCTATIDYKKSFEIGLQNGIIAGKDVNFKWDGSKYYWH